MKQKRTMNLSKIKEDYQSKYNIGILIYVCVVCIHIYNIFIKYMLYIYVYIHIKTRK